MYSLNVFCKVMFVSALKYYLDLRINLSSGFKVFSLDINIKRHHTNVTTSALLTDWYQYSRLLDF